MTGTIASRFRILAWMMAALFAAIPPALADDGPDMDTLQQAVVHIWTYTPPTDQSAEQVGFGSGFVVSRDGYIVTNHHVTAGARLISVLLPGENEPRSREELRNLFLKGRSATVLYISEARDLAVIKVGKLPNAPLMLTDEPLSKNMRIYAFGYPGAADDLFQAPTADPTMTNGVIGRLYSAQESNSSEHESIPVIQHNATINHGNSGGPLVDDCGRVVGINTWGNFSLAKNSSGQSDVMVSSGVYYASNVLNLISFLRANNVPFTATSDVCHSTLAIVWERGLLWAAIASVFLLTLTLAFFPRSRALVVETVGRSAEAVSRRVGGSMKKGASAAPATRAVKKKPADATTAMLQTLRFAGRQDAARHSFEIGRDKLMGVKNGTVIGRLAGGVDVLIDNDEISRRHARVFMDQGRVVIEDLGSTNGTKVDGLILLPNMPAPLSDASVVRLGPLWFDVKFR